MFTDKKNVLELISLLKAHSIEHAVLCPGSRDIPIVQGISQFSDISCLFIKLPILIDREIWYSNEVTTNPKEYEINGVTYIVYGNGYWY